MFTSEVQIRVRYAETDQMGYVYYGNFAAYFEVARTEAFRKLGISYKEMEADGVMMPVLEMKTKFIRPARYDDLLTIKLRIEQKPAVRTIFLYETYSEDGTLLNTAETTLVFVDITTGRPTAAPKSLQHVMEAYFAT